MAGWVYIMSNPKIPGLLKVGYTEKDTISRAKEISDSTGVPSPYEVEYQVYTTHPFKFEQQAHKLLAKYRWAKNREFFECDYEDVVEGIREAIKNCTDSIKDFSYTGETSYKILNAELDKKILEKQKRIQEAEAQRKEDERKKYELWQKKKREDDENKKKRLEAERIEDRQKLVIEFQRKEQKEIFLKQVKELEKHLSEREKYAYHFSLPLEDIELKQWILNPDINGEVLLEYFSKHYPDIYPCFSIYPRNHNVDNIIDIPTQEDIAKLRLLQEFVDKKLEEQRRLEEQKRLEDQRILEEQRKLEEQKRLEEQRKLEEQKRLEEQRKLEEQKRLEEQRKLEKQKTLEEQERQLRIRVLKAEQQKLQDLEKEKQKIKKAFWLLYINDNNKFAMWGVLWLLITTLLFLLDICSVIDINAAANIFLKADSSIFMQFLLKNISLVMFFIAFVLIVPVVYKNKKYALRKIDEEISYVKNLIEKLNQ